MTYERTKENEMSMRHEERLKLKTDEWRQSPNFILCSYDPYESVFGFSEDAASPDMLIRIKRLQKHPLQRGYKAHIERFV